MYFLIVRVSLVGRPTQKPTRREVARSIWARRSKSARRQRAASARVKHIAQREEMRADYWVKNARTTNTVCRRLGNTKRNKMSLFLRLKSLEKLITEFRLSSRRSSDDLTSFVFLFFFGNSNIRNWSAKEENDCIKMKLSLCWEKRARRTQRFAFIHCACTGVANPSLCEHKGIESMQSRYGRLKLCAKWIYHAKRFIENG